MLSNLKGGLFALLLFLSINSFASEHFNIKEFVFSSVDGKDKDRIAAVTVLSGKLKLLAYGRDSKEKMVVPEQEGFLSRRLRRYIGNHQYLGLINASMFKKDYLTSVAYMRDGEYFNNKVHVEKYSGLFVFNPKDSNLKPFDIIEKPLAPKWQSLIENYNTVIENYRTISNGKNLWTSNKRHKFMFQLGINNKDQLVLISYESRVGRSVKEFNEKVLELPLGIVSAVYLDGGPHGILQVKQKGQLKEFGATKKAFSPNFIVITKP